MSSWLNGLMAALKAPPSQDFLQKTLGAQLLTGVTASATLNNTTGLQNLPGVMVVDRINTNNVETPSQREVIGYGGTSGSTITSLARGLGGTSDQDHAVGAIVEFAPDVVWAQSIYDALSNVVDVTTSAVDLTKIVTPGGSQTLTNKTITAGTLSGDTNLSTTTGNFTVSGADPKRGFYVPAVGIYGATTNGAATGQIETSSNKVNAKVLDFDASTEEYGCFSIPAPDYWDLSTITAQFVWTAASGSGDAIWALQALARSNDDALDTAYGTAQTVTDTLISTGDEHLTSATSAITVGGTPAKSDTLYFRVYRDADAGGDTLNADARLIGIRIKFGIGQYDDQ